MHPLAERLWHTVPKIGQDLVASSIDRLRGVTPPPFPTIQSEKPIRLMVGPVNYAGQGFRWCRIAETTGKVSATNFVHVENNPLGYPADYTLTWRTAEHSRAWQKSMLQELSQNYTHVLIEACFPILGGRYSGDMRRQIAEMQDAGLRVGIVGHGNDVRLPSRHAAREKWSPFHTDEWVPPERLESVVAANLELIEELRLPTFVSTAGLLVDIPWAHLLPVIIDQDRWAPHTQPLLRDRIRVVHAPTNPIAKGTTFIAPIARKLHDEGLIEYVELQGIPNEQMPSVFAEADVVLDQFRGGDYGVAACETMASGRIVVAHIDDQVRGEVERRAGMPLPIVSATIDRVEEVIRDIARDRTHYQSVAAQGPRFVATLHGGNYSRDALMRHFLEAE